MALLASETLLTPESDDPHAPYMCTYGAGRAPVRTRKVEAACAFKEKAACDSSFNTLSSVHSMPATQTLHRNVMCHTNELM